jgi:hypothetical protein
MLRRAEHSTTEDVAPEEEETLCSCLESLNLGQGQVAPSCEENGKASVSMKYRVSRLNDGLLPSEEEPWFVRLAN